MLARPIFEASAAIVVTLSWTNNEPTDLTNQISVEVQEWDDSADGPALQGNANFFTAAVVSAGSTSAELLLQMDSTYKIEIRTYAVDGVAVSAPSSGELR